MTHPLLIILRNTRPLQIIYHIGLMTIGAGIALLFVPLVSLPALIPTMTLLLTVPLAWISTVFFNDVTDLAIDRVSNPLRPLPQGILTTQQSMALGWFTLGTSLVLAFSVSLPVFYSIVIYHTLSWMYSMPPLRLKQFPFLATFIAALASLAIIFAGFFLVTLHVQSLLLFPLSMFVVLLTGYTLCLPLKDFRDIAGDRADGVRTLPVIFGEDRARTILASHLTLSFLLSALLLDMSHLAIPALIASLSAVSVMTLRAQKKAYIVSVPHMLPSIFLITSLYGLILVYILFF